MPFIKISFHRLLIGILTTLLLEMMIVSCTRKPAYEKKVVARVGEREITVDEFRYCYEFGLGAIKKGANPRQTYLDFMIKELVLANEGFSLGLNQSPYVTIRLQQRRKNDLLEAFYTKYVYNKVKIPEEKLEDAIKKSTISFRLITWPTATLDEAEAVRVRAAKTSLEDYVEDQLGKQELKLSSKEFYETDWMDYLDIPPVIFNKIKDLEVGRPSEPFPLGNGYAVAEVLDIHLKGITEEQLKYGARRKNIEKRLINIQADSIMHSMMDSVLTPLDVRVKSSVVEELARPLYQWVKNGLPEGQSVFTLLDTPADTAKDYIHDIHQILNQTLLTYKNGKKTVADYLDYMDYYRRTLKESGSFEDFNARLLAEIGRMVMNETFLSIAESEGFGDSLSVKEDLRVWEQKWTYDAYRYELVKNIGVTGEEMKNYFKNRYNELGIADVDTTRFYKYENDVYRAVLYEKQQKRLQEELEQLRKKYSVSVDEKVLAELDLTQSKKSNNITYIVRKNFSGEPVMPAIDLKWFHL